MVKTLKKRNGIYYARIRVNPTDRMTEKTLKTRDKEIARKRLNELATQMEREAEGIATPTKMKNAAQLPLGIHLSRYITARESEWSSAKHAQASRDRLNKLIRECGWKKLVDIDALSFTDWRTRQTLSPKTLNEYLSVLNQFIQWLVDNSFIEENVIKKIKRIKTRGRTTFTRRAFTMDEIALLLNAVKSKPARHAVYLAAIHTGLRRKELENLEWGDVHFEAKIPFLAARASTTKNGKDAVIPLHTDLLDALIRLKSVNAKPEDRVFQVPAIETFRADLKRAGIVYEDKRRGRADFHALRKTFGTLMQLSGVQPRVAQELMRHSDIKLTTQIYTDANLLPTAAAIRSIPSVLNAPHTDPKNVAKWDKTSPAVSQTKVGNGLHKANNENQLGAMSPGVSQGGEWCSGWDSNPHGI